MKIWGSQFSGTRTFLGTFVGMSLICAPFIASAATIAKPAPVVKKPKLSVAVWMPYWKKASGTPEMMAHLDKVNTISPFAYEVDDDGTIQDAMKLATDPWTSLVASATPRGVKIIPTIMWIHGNAIHATLSATSSRAAHVADIMSMVNRNKFDGIDIDYENKIIDSRYYFSQFLKELAGQLHAEKKTLVCTIEARTPPSSLYKVMPSHIEHVNDYKVINKYCDEVRIMTYDQSTADIKLNKSKGDGVFYAPVADASWVKKVIVETTKTIDKKKIMLGVATYGYEYQVDTSGDDPVYTRLRSISHPDAIMLAESVGAKTMRNVSGEISFAYTKNNMPRFVTWSDGKAIAAKVALAKQYGLKGVAVFKVDGMADPAMWDVLK